MTHPGSPLRDVRDDKATDRRVKRDGVEVGAVALNVGYGDDMATIKKGLVTSSGEWRKHLRWLKRAFWKTERQAVKATARRNAAER